MKKLIIIALTLFTIAAQAQEDSTYRKGFLIGFGIGGGVISIADSKTGENFDHVQGGMSFPNLKIGFMINDRLAFIGTMGGMMYDLEDKDRSFQTIAPTIQFWIKDRWYINGGLGLAMDMPALYEIEDFESEDWNFGCALVASTGYEVFKRRNFAIDVQGKLLLGRTNLGDDQHRDAASFFLGLGFNWY
ncbi:MAG: hypothetical protein R2728_16155 [Chitinophagales bacterium]